MTAHDAIDQVLARVNDRGGIIHARALVLKLISQCQQSINGASRDVRGTATFQTVTAQPFYKISEVLPSCLTMEYAEAEGEELNQVPYESLQTLDASWIRARADRPDYWASIGKDLLILYPATVSPITVTARYVLLTPELGSEDDDLVLPPERIDQLIDLVDSVLLFRERKFDEMESTLTRIVGASERQ